MTNGRLVRMPVAGTVKYKCPQHVDNRIRYTLVGRRFHRAILSKLELSLLLSFCFSSYVERDVKRPRRFLCSIYIPWNQGAICHQEKNEKVERGSQVCHMRVHVRKFQREFRGIPWSSVEPSKGNLHSFTEIER